MAQEFLNDPGCRNEVKHLKRVRLVEAYERIK
jgi:hypothetical protein